MDMGGGDLDGPGNCHGRQKRWNMESGWQVCFGSNCTCIHAYLSLYNRTVHCQHSPRLIETQAQVILHNGKCLLLSEIDQKPIQTYHFYRLVIREHIAAMCLCVACFVDKHIHMTAFVCP